MRLNFRDGLAFVEFERTASTLEAAIASAISKVEGVDDALRVLHVESENAKAVARINADLLRSTGGDTMSDDARVAGEDRWLRRTQH